MSSFAVAEIICRHEATQRLDQNVMIRESRESMHQLHWVTDEYSQRNSSDDTSLFKAPMTSARKASKDVCNDE